VAQRNQRIEAIRKSSNTNQDASVDIAAAKQALELSKSSTDNDITRELEQIKLYNSRLEILDKEVQKWIDQGTGNLFRKSGLDQARVVKEGQSNERSDIDVQIKSSQDRISKLREQYASQVKEYNERVASIENRNKSQRGEIETSIKNIEKEITDIEASVVSYNKETDDKISSLNKNKEDSVEKGKKKISDYQENIKVIRVQNTELQDKIVGTDVGTFKFIASSLGIPLEKAVNYFIWSIMAVFDPLAICLILAFNSLIGDKNKKQKNNSIEKTNVINLPSINTLTISTPEPTQVFVATSTPSPTETPAPTPTSTPSPTETPTPTEIIIQTPVDTSSENINVAVAPPPPPVVPHGIYNGKIHPRQ
jgi:hypothetical protein